MDANIVSGQLGSYCFCVIVTSVFKDSVATTFRGPLVRVCTSVSPAKLRAPWAQEEVWASSDVVRISLGNK